MTELSHRRITPKELRQRGWTATAGRIYTHKDGWTITHCGHPTAHWPYILTTPDGRVLLTGVAFSGNPRHGTAWPSVASAVDFVALKGMKYVDANH